MVQDRACAAQRLPLSNQTKHADADWREIEAAPNHEERDIGNAPVPLVFCEFGTEQSGKETSDNEQWKAESEDCLAVKGAGELCIQDISDYWSEGE